MPCSLPRWTGQVLVGFFPARVAFPDFEAGRHPHHYFRGLLKLHTRYGLQGCSPTLLWALSRGFTLTSYPMRALASYQIQPTTTWMGPSPTGDPRLWGALKIFTRRGSNSSGAHRYVAGIEKSIRVPPEAKGTVGRCLCPGDYVPHDSAPER